LSDVKFSVDSVQQQKYERWFIYAELFKI